jgi:hypothetical protein
LLFAHEGDALKPISEILTNVLTNTWRAKGNLRRGAGDGLESTTGKTSNGVNAAETLLFGGCRLSEPATVELSNKSGAARCVKGALRVDDTVGGNGEDTVSRGSESNGPGLIPARADANAQTVPVGLTRTTTDLAPLRPLIGVSFDCVSIHAAVGTRASATRMVKPNFSAETVAGVQPICAGFFDAPKRVLAKIGAGPLLKGGYSCGPADAADIKAARSLK